MAFAGFVRTAHFNDAVAGLSIRQDGAGDAYEAIGPNSTPYYVGTRAGEANNVYEVVPIVDGVEIRLGPGGGTAPDVILRRNTAATLTLVGALSFTGDVFITDGNGLIVGHTAQITNEGTPEVQVLGTGADDSALTLGRWSNDASQPLIHLVKSRETTIGSFTIVEDDDALGGIIWLPDDGADFDTQVAQFRVEVDDATPAAGDIGVAFVWLQMPGNGAGAIAETMRLENASGSGPRLGLGVEPSSGTAGPLLHLETSAVNSSAQIILRSTDTTGSVGATLTLDTPDTGGLNPSVVFTISGAPTVRTFRIGNDNATPSQLIFTRDGVALNLLAISSTVSKFETPTVRMASRTAASTANLVNLIHALETDDSEQIAAQIVTNWQDIANATRTARLRFFITNSATATVLLTLQGVTAILGSGDGGTVAATGRTLRAPDIITGGAGNLAGADITFAAGLGTGTGDVGTIIFQLPIVAAAGDNIQTLATRLTLDMDGSTTVLTMTAAQAMTVITAAGDLNFNPAGNIVFLGNSLIQDDSAFSFGTGSDTRFLNRSTTLAADEEIGAVIEGTSNHQGVAADSLIISNRTNDGDILMLVSDGGNSKEFLLADADVAFLHLGFGMINTTVYASGDITLNSGGNVVLANDSLIQRDVNAGLTASTTQNQGQGALTAEVNEVSTVANADDTVTLPTAVAGLKIVIINNGANQVQIFPASGDNLGSGVDTATSLAAGSNITFVAFDDTNWEIV